MGRAIIHDNVRKYVKQLLWSYTTSQRSQWVVKLNMNSADSPGIENCGNFNKSQYVDHSLKISPQITTLTTIYITSSLRYFFSLAQSQNQQLKNAVTLTLQTRACLYTTLTGKFTIARPFKLIHYYRSAS